MNGLRKNGRASARGGSGCEAVTFLRIDFGLGLFAGYGGFEIGFDKRRGAEVLDQLLSPFGGHYLRCRSFLVGVAGGGDGRFIGGWLFEGWLYEAGVLEHLFGLKLQVGRSNRPGNIFRVVQSEKVGSLVTA